MDEANEPAPLYPGEIWHLGQFGVQQVKKNRAALDLT